MPYIYRVIKKLLIVGLMLLFFTPSKAEKKHITGKCYNNVTKDSLPGVIILNIYTGNITTTDSVGNFSLEMEDEELIEFKMLGYNTARIRMRSFLDAKYYSIGLTPTPTPLEIKREEGFYADSLYWARFFSGELSYIPMTTAEIINNPIGYFSKTNRNKRKFQETFYQFIADEFVNEYFNAEYVASISPLTGKDLNNFLIFYRPTYIFARSMSKYDFLLWIKGASNLYYEQLKYKEVQQE